MNREVNLTKLVQTSKGPRYCPVVWATNGRIRPDVALVNGQPERHTQGAYYLEWREGAKRVRLSVGKDAVDADNRRKRKAAELNAVNEGAAVVTADGTRSLVALVAEYLEETKLTKKPKTLAAYGTALRYFLESCHKLNIEDVDRKDLLKFSAFLRDVKDQAPRSVYNKFENLMSFLKANGIRGLV
jgi:integrase/recombinase XerD